VGFVMATWLVSIPAVEARAGISHATLGLLLLVLGIGAIVAIQAAGFLNARFGSKSVVIAGFTLDVIAVNLPTHAPSVWTLGVALFVFGFGNATADVAMNDQAVAVERQYARPIMSAFHALWSVGGAAGALAGAATRSLGMGTGWSTGAGSVVGAILGGISVFGLLAHSEATAHRTKVHRDAAPVPRRTVLRKVALFGTLALLLMLSEGVVADWGALHAVQHLRQTEAAAALAYGVFAIAMTLMRLTADRVAHRFGPVFVVRYGSLTGALGVVIVVLSPVYPLTLAGWAVFGLGLAGVVPQLFTAAGNIDPANPSVPLSRVFGLGYVGMLAGPATIGALAGWVGLNQAFLFPLLCCLTGVSLAGLVAPPRRPRGHDAAPVGTVSDGLVEPLGQVLEEQ
jgi:MFS family permease